MDKELRQMLLTLRKEREDFCQLRRELREQGNDWLPYPEHLRAIPCGATTRAGTPCKMTTIYHNGRCKLHGGKSTGAKTRTGRKRQRDGYRAWLKKQRDSKAGRKRTREYTSNVARVGASTLSELGASETDRALQSVDGISLRFSGGTLMVMLPHGHSIAVTITTTSPGYGGVRWWYVCPDCGGRKAFLYLHNESLCCRRCAGLHYASQSK